MKNFLTTMFKRMFYFAAMIAFSCIIISSVLATYWTIKDYKVQTYTNPIAILNKDHVIHPGETIRWDVDITNFAAYKFMTIQEIVGANPTVACDYKILPILGGVLQVGHIKRINATNVLPEGFKPCVYYVRITNVITLNPLRTVTIVKQTDNFTVI